MSFIPGDLTEEEEEDEKEEEIIALRH